MAGWGCSVWSLYIDTHCISSRTTNRHEIQNLADCISTCTVYRHFQYYLLTCLIFCSIYRFYYLETIVTVILVGKEYATFATLIIKSNVQF